LAKKNRRGNIYSAAECEKGRNIAEKMSFRICMATENGFG
jgi:hypothetical protein